jgi:hypothetical protein
MSFRIWFAAALVIGSVMCCAGQSARAAAPALLMPDNNAEPDNGCADRSNAIEWRFERSEIPKARRYHLYVIGSGAKYPVVDMMNIKSASYRHDRPSAYITDSNRRAWRWKVRVLVGKVWSDWSEERAFDVEPIDTDCS